MKFVSAGQKLLNRLTKSNNRRTLKLTVIGLLIGLVLASGLLVSHPAQAEAPRSAERQTAITLAAASPAFAEGLAARPNWTARAYDTGNKYGIWHVEFMDALGNPIGTADVSLKYSRVLSFQAEYDATDAQTAQAQAIIEPFVRKNRDLINLVGEMPIIYVWHAYQNIWVAHIELGPDTVEAFIQFDTETYYKFERPKLIGIKFPNITSIDEWTTQQTTKATTIAFRKSEIVAALRDANGWTSTGEESDNGWLVKFMLGDREVANATVDITGESVVNFEVK